MNTRLAPCFLWLTFVPKVFEIPAKYRFVVKVLAWSFSLLPSVFDLVGPVNLSRVGET